MIEVVFVLRGQTVTPGEIEDARERAVLLAIEKSLKDRVGGLRCAEHGAVPRVTATGSRADALDFELAGCCDELMAKTTECLS